MQKILRKMLPYELWAKAPRQHQLRDGKVFGGRPYVIPKRIQEFVGSPGAHINGYALFLQGNVTQFVG
jgi:hypothetical protein